MSDRAVREGLAELSGVRVCDAPRCDRQLKDGQGRRMLLGLRPIRTCFATPCTSWADDQMKSFA